MKKIYLVFLALSVFLLTNCYEDMRGGYHHREHRSGKYFKKRIYRMHDKMSSKLDLTEEQEKSLETITENLLEKKRELKMRETREKERKLIYESLTQKKIQTDKLKNLQKEKANKKIEFRNFQIEEYSKFYESLTNKQKNRLARFMRDRWDDDNDLKPSFYRSY